jgi:enamine deaminase RidA (YjgF/YER057c/UK114 family)
MGVVERLTELGIELPPPPQPVASYAPVVTSGSLAFVAGQVAIVDGEVLHPGLVGAEVSVEQAREAARRCALQALSALQEAVGDLDRVRRIVQVTVFVASSPGFRDQPQVANGASDLLVDVFGDAGRHARAAVGVVGLPLGGPVEVAVIAEVAVITDVA